MVKFADRYLKVCPWEVIEEGFKQEYSRVSESIFSLGNEYMGVRGYFDEGYSGDQLVGSYMNGVFEEEKITPLGDYKSMVTNTSYMINTVDWLYTRITVDEETLDLAKSKITNFIRCLDMKRGILTREFIWSTTSGKNIKISFVRFLSMSNSKLGCQQVSLEAINFSGKVNVKSALDFSPIHETSKKNL